MNKLNTTRQDEIDSEIKAHQRASNKAYKEAKKATAYLNKVMKEENHFYLKLILVTGDKRRRA